MWDIIFSWLIFNLFFIIFNLFFIFDIILNGGFILGRYIIRYLPIEVGIAYRTYSSANLLCKNNLPVINEVNTVTWYSPYLWPFGKCLTYPVSPRLVNCLTGSWGWVVGLLVCPWLNDEISLGKYKPLFWHFAQKYLLIHLHIVEIQMVRKLSFYLSINDTSSSRGDVVLFSSRDPSLSLIVCRSSGGIGMSISVSSSPNVTILVVKSSTAS